MYHILQCIQEATVQYFAGTCETEMCAKVINERCLPATHVIYYRPLFAVIYIFYEYV